MSRDSNFILIKNLSKKFGDFYANKNINISVPQGDCHAFIGQNGSGKSTLIGMLSGRITPTEGQIFIDNEELHYGDPQKSREIGIVTIFQELTIIPGMTALDNVFLGYKKDSKLFVNKKLRVQRFKELAEMLNTKILPNELASSLSIAEQQTLEIMRCLNLNSNILILDEPTSSLAQSERDALLETLLGLKERGITIIYISHHLNEIMHICDSFTILNNGTVIEHTSIDGWNREKIVHSMLGEEVDSDFKKILDFEYPQQKPFDEVLFSVENLSSFDFLKDISFHIKKGEILGLGGLVGSGRTAIASTLYGLGNKVQGKMKLENKEINVPKSPRDAIKQGIVLAPEDRKKVGLHLELEVHENINMINLPRTGKAKFFSKRISKQLAKEFIEDYKLSRPIESLVKNLSGGNQQKVLLAKVTSVNPKILIVDEPTRGIDIGVKLEVLRKLKELALTGVSIIVISSELEEVVAVSNRVLVVSQGKIVNELEGENISVNKIIESSFLERS